MAMPAENLNLSSLLCFCAINSKNQNQCKHKFCNTSNVLFFFLCFLNNNHYIHNSDTDTDQSIPDVDWSYTQKHREV